MYQRFALLLVVSINFEIIAEILYSSGVFPRFGDDGLTKVA
jgi:hypothetical protein